MGRIATMSSKYHLNIEAFTNIQSPEIAYILGFLWADGHVRKIGNSYITSVHIIKDDMDKLLPVFREAGVWAVYNSQSKGRKPQTHIKYSSKPFGEYLDSLSYLDKSKASACKVLLTVPEHLKHYWFRGYFDGDGCVSLYKGKYPWVTFSGSYNQDYTFLIGLLNTLKIPFKYNQIERVSKVTGNKSSSSSIRFKQRDDVKKFYEYIYQGQIFGLFRKQEKFIEAYKEGQVKRNKRYLYKGQNNTLEEWSKVLNIARSTLNARLRCGWSLEKALTTPKDIRKSKRSLTNLDKI